MALDLRIGFELELLAPPTSSRLELARAIAADHGGAVRPSFHLDTEPSKAPGVAVFHHLTPAFDVVDGDGAPLCRLVDDVTIQDDLDRMAPPLPGWHRIVSDDRRMLRLVERHADAGAPIDTCLESLGRLFGTAPRRHGDFVRVDDESGTTVAIAAPLPGERHRPCEIVTPPIGADHGVRLERLLRPARDLGFTVPSEAAVHLHVDAAPLRHPRTLRDLVRLVAPFEEVLRWMVATNPRCRRLGPVPEALRELVEEPRFVDLPWPAARARLLDLGLSKYRDLNLRNLVSPPPGKDTVEWRIHPGALEAGPVVEAAELLQAIVRRATSPEPVERRFDAVAAGLAGARELLDEIGLDADAGRWIARQVVDIELSG